MAHLQGVIHRDLKPANVLLSNQTPKIVDFGVARRWDVADGVTLTGSLLGTPEYMAPEQAVGDPKQVGPATDIYALGVILYELLTGRPPFAGSSPLQVIQRIAAENPPPLQSPHATIPRDLQAITLKCLQKHPSRRYATAESLADDLRRFLDGLPIQARPTGPVTRACQWCRRYPVVASLVALLAVSLLSGAIISGRFALIAIDQAKYAQLEAHAAQEAKKLAQQMAESAQAARRNAQAQAYDARALLLQSAWSNHESIRFNELIDSLRPDSEEDLRGFEWYYWQQKLRSGHKALQTQQGLLAGAQFTHDGRHIIFGGLTGQVSLIDAKSMATLWSHDLGSGQVSRVRISPDDRLAAVVCEGSKAFLLDMSSGTTLRTLNSAEPITDIRFTRKGLFSIDKQGLVQVWNVDSAEEMDCLQCESRMGANLEVTQDGSHVITFSTFGKLQLWNMTSKQLVAMPGDDTILGSQFSLSPDENLLAIINSDGELQICDARTLQPKYKPLVVSVALDCVDFDSTGRNVLVGGFDSTLRRFDAQTGLQLESYLAHAGQFLASCFIQPIAPLS